MTELLNTKWEKFELSLSGQKFSSFFFYLEGWSGLKTVSLTKLLTHRMQESVLKLFPWPFISRYWNTSVSPARLFLLFMMKFLQ